MADDSKSCCVCHVEFAKKQNKSFGRVSVVSITSPRTFSLVYPQASTTRCYKKGQFLCLSCIKVMRLQTKRKRKGAAKRTFIGAKSLNSQTQSPQRKLPRIEQANLHNESDNSFHEEDDTCSESEEGPLTGSSILHKAIQQLRTYKYTAAFRTLCKNSPAAAQGLCQVASELIKKEVSAVKAEVFSQTPTEETIDKFSWTNFCSEAEKCMPKATTCLKALFPSVSKVRSHQIKGLKGAKRKMTEEEARIFLDMRLGTLISVALFTKKPRKFKFIPACMSVQLWRQGASLKVFKTLNAVGISQGVDSARSHVDRLGATHNKKLLNWQHAVEFYKRYCSPHCRDPVLVLRSAMLLMSTEPPEGESAQFPHAVVRLNLPAGAAVIHKASSYSQIFSTTVNAKKLTRWKKDMNGYAFCWDNVQIGTKTKHYHSESETKFPQMAMCFAVKDRVAHLHLKDPTVLNAVDLDPYAFLPDSHAFQQKRRRMELIATTVLLDNLEFLEELRSKVLCRIPHRYSKEMSSPSEIVNMGIVQTDPASTTGSIEVLQHAQKYVPKRNGEELELLVSGDGLTVEQMLQAQRAMNGGELSCDRLEYAWPCPQEFNKDILLLTDANDLLLKGASAADRGTFTQIRNLFGHKEMTRDVMASYQHNNDFYEFVTHGYVLLYAIRQLGIQNLTTVPDSYVGTWHEKLEWLKRLAKSVVDFCWLGPLKEDIDDVARGLHDGQNETLSGCMCGNDGEESLVKCCNLYCCQTLFHPECADDAVEHNGDWYCSSSCSESEHYIYCSCNQHREGTMIMCSAEDKCKYHEWYHPQCVGIAANNVVPDLWFCSSECALGSEDDDYVLNHSKRIMWEGLKFLSRRDAVREGDGPAMMMDWKFDLLQFWQNRHPKYLINAHFMLAAVGGFAPERIRANYVWNRVANPLGQPRGNVGLDLVNRHLNLDFKEMLRSRGNYREQVVSRCAQMSGAHGKRLDGLFTDTDLGKMTPAHRKTQSGRYRKDLIKFVEEYSGDALCDYIPPRSHKSFRKFTNSRNVNNSRQLGIKLKQLSKSLDTWRNGENLSS